MARSIKLVWVPPTPAAMNNENYEVILVKNSTDYRPGEILTKSEVDSLFTDKPAWEVTIVGKLRNTKEVS